MSTAMLPAPLSWLGNVPSLSGRQPAIAAEARRQSFEEMTPFG